MVRSTDRFVIISGCSGGGKSTLIQQLQRRGHSVIEEPGRRIIAVEQRGNGAALPWVNPEAFANRAIQLALSDIQQAKALPGYVFFDRGLIDAAAALEHLTNCPVLADYADLRFNRCVFLAPPWPEIYVGDDERRHGLDEAIAEYDRLLGAYDSLAYEVVVLPKDTVSARADFILDWLEHP